MTTSSRSDELAYMSIAELAAEIRARRLSPVELVNAALERVQARNDSINAFVYMNEDYARTRAKEVEAAIARGEDLGPLQGLPTSIKDLSDSRPGWKGTMGGIRALKDHVIDGYCTFAQRMERAGAIPLGKTNSPTFGFRGTCDNFLFGPTRNPFDTTKNSGGSSGGSAAAVADGLIPFGEGTDGGGSIRIPAAWTNLYGFKGTSGRVSRLSRPQAFSLTGLFTYEGCVTRSVEDTAYVMQALTGPDERDPNSLRETVDWLGALRESIKGRRIAYTPDFGAFPVDPRVRELVGEAVHAFEDAGAHVEEVRIEMPYRAQELGDLWCRLMVPNNLLQVVRLQRAGIDLLGEHRADLPPEFVYYAERAQNQSLVELADDQAMRTQVYDAIQPVLDDYDFLIGPTLICPPVDNGTDGNTVGPAEVDGEAINRLIGFCPTLLFNFTGHPAASVPAGLVEGRWPAGLRIIGRRFADADVIAASAAYEAARPWRQHYEICRQRS